jgi:Flp pilus assembly protein TadG
MPSRPAARRARQPGVATVEFALVALLFFTLLFGALEFGRMLYLYNTVQEVTRRAAREAVVRWIDQGATIRTLALFGAASVPAGAEITAAAITIDYLKKNGDVITAFPTDPGDNLSACSDASRSDNCIYSVRVEIAGNVKYRPMLSLFGLFQIDLPRSTVVMPAESLGFTIN